MFGSILRKQSPFPRVAALGNYSSLVCRDVGLRHLLFGRLRALVARRLTLYPVQPGLKVADPVVTMMCSALSVLLTAPLLGRTCKVGGN